MVAVGLNIVMVVMTAVSRDRGKSRGCGEGRGCGDGGEHSILSRDVHCIADADMEELQVDEVHM